MARPACQANVKSGEGMIPKNTTAAAETRPTKAISG
jgi:hypothetical protein